MSGDRVPTFIHGFDEALDGGIPKGSVVLVCGTPGTMKTSIVFNLLYNNVKANGSKGLYISLEETNEDLRTAMKGLGMDGIDDMELYILDVAKIRIEHKEEEMAKNWLEILMRYIDQRVNVNDFDLVAIDSMAGLYSLTDMERPRRELFHFYSFLKSLDATTFLISEIPYGSKRLVPYDEDFLSDGIFLMKQYEMGETDVQLRIRCVKMRRTPHQTGYFTLIRRPDGFAVTNVISEAV
jgi:circadian clock protein KaiC